MPALRTVYDWLERDPKLSARFTHARTAGFDQIAMDMLRIADTPVTAIKQTVRTWKGKKSVDVTTEDAIAHRKLQIETRAKLLACWDPSRYGTKVAVEGNVNHNFAQQFASAMARVTTDTAGGHDGRTH